MEDKSMKNKNNLDFLILEKEKLDSWRGQYNPEYLRQLSDEEAEEYKLMTTIKEENLLENGKAYFGDISLKEMETKLEYEIKRREKQKRDEFFDKVIELKEKLDNDQNNRMLLDQIMMLFASYYKNITCITTSAILSTIDNEIMRRKNNNREQLAVDSDCDPKNYTNCSKKDVSYSLKRN